MRAIVSFVFVFVLGWSPTSADDFSVASPDGLLRAEVNVSSSGLSYRVFRDETLIIRSSELGFTFLDGTNFEADTNRISSSRRAVDETWEQPWGEARFIHDIHNELAVSIPRNGVADETMTVRFRVFDDGLGFRYEYQAPAGRSLVIADELTEFNFAEDADTWWIPAGEWNRYEYLYEKTPLSKVKLAHTPITMRRSDGIHISVHEAALVDYAGMWFKQTAGTNFTAELAPNPLGGKVHTTGGFKTPWRTLQVTEAATGLLNSHLILNLNEPSRLGDVSWIKPGKYVGIWWGMHLNINTWGSGERHGATTANTKHHIDFAAKHGFDGVLVEGWNVGWDGNWFDNGDVFSFTKPYPDFDIKALSDYALEKGVRLIGHHETSGGVTNYENQMAEAYKLYEDLGVRQIKTGYVANGGNIVRKKPDGTVVNEWHDGQWMSNHNIRLLELAAKHKLSINSHEPIKDTGLRRTYPNWISREGARGQEYNAWGSPGNPPSHTAILPFTRMLSGPLDFTPGIFDLLFEEEKPDNRVETTLAKQLALYVVLFSPIQMAADLPANYEARPDALQFIKDVVTDFEQSIALAGEIGEYAIYARKDRNSDDWFMGGLTGDNEQSKELKLDFLDPDKRYLLQLYRDSDDAHWRSNPYGFVVEEKQVNATETISVRMAPGGGFAARLVPVSD
ncbi:MAG: glycoside hydrolase family 97 protein [Kordiimonadaceae bacterium]|nr:glycoside hydrolase family 97 protein [Kordiimonadaceae bacterium]MBO6570442.1 glycoside hydrolase family 97 protein [Kordiimonadaceae bacterium]MBO6966439.1 glycoside hydrolase family 97 protein [Kordiimonadaceae bacterium]